MGDWMGVAALKPRAARIETTVPNGNEFVPKNRMLPDLMNAVRRLNTGIRDTTYRLQSVSDRALGPLPATEPMMTGNLSDTPLAPETIPNIRSELDESFRLIDILNSIINNLDDL